MGGGCLRRGMFFFFFNPGVGVSDKVVGKGRPKVDFGE